MKNVLITGASRGIGKAAAYEFSKNGYRVFINYNKSECEAEKTAKETGAVIIKADISNKDEVRKMADFIHNNYGKIDVLVNNAGISQIKMFTDISESDWDRMFDVNIKGMYLVTKAFINDMISRQSGKIINISSMWGITGGSCEVHYSASKAAVIGFTKALAKELGPSKICVNCIAPGVIETEMNSHLSDEDMECLCDETPLERIGKPEEVAKAILFLASENADFITGQVLNVDGGMVI
jgi:3-oxoacyl-[acyl-carrier protein] reductase